MKTKIQIIDETVNAYKKPNTRGFIITNDFASVKMKPVCQYKTHDGKMCAVGRCLTPKSIESIENLRGSVSSVFIDIETLDAALKPEYRGHTMYFWAMLQQLHDGAIFWDPINGGLSADGKANVIELKRQFSK